MPENFTFPRKDKENECYIFSEQKYIQISCLITKYDQNSIKEINFPRICTTITCIKGNPLIIGIKAINPPDSSNNYRNKQIKVIYIENNVQKSQGIFSTSYIDLIIPGKIQLKSITSDNYTVLNEPTNIKLVILMKNHFPSIDKKGFMDIIIPNSLLNNVNDINCNAILPKLSLKLICEFDKIVGIIKITHSFNNIDFSNGDIEININKLRNPNSNQTGNIFSIK